MFFKKNIEIQVCNDYMLLMIYAICKNKQVGRIVCCIDKERRLITLSDITCKRNNRGYGSLMMEKLIEFAEDGQFEYIYGWLSTVDINHVKRSYHFYHKFGFEITECSGNIKFADIKLEL